MNDKAIVTFSMLVIGALVLVAETDWLVRAREFIQGKVAGGKKGGG